MPLVFGMNGCGIRRSSIFGSTFDLQRKAAGFGCTTDKAKQGKKKKKKEERG